MTGSTVRQRFPRQARRAAVRRAVPRAVRHAVAGIAVLAAVVSLAACNDDTRSVASAAAAGDQKGYVGGDGSVEQLAPSQRTKTVSLSGTTVTGGSWSMAKDGAGKVVVVNVWGSWCPPCTTELPHLQAAWVAYQKSKAPVAFVGIDKQESSATGASYLEANNITYPSINDQASQGQPLLALYDTATATPTTLVLDRQGRVAARVLGPASQRTITDLVDGVVAEQS